jgi:hypothetical protein
MYCMRGHSLLGARIYIKDGYPFRFSDLNLIAVLATYRDGSEIAGRICPGPEFQKVGRLARQADKQQDTKEAQRLVSIAENWITLAKIIPSLR